MGSSLFVINSSPAIRRLVERAARNQGYEVATFTDGSAALEEAQRVKPAVIIADYQIEGLPCTTFCDKLNEMELIPNTLVALLVNPSDQYDESDMRSRGVKAFLPKPFRPDQINKLIKELGDQAAEAPQPAAPGKAWPPESSAIGAEGEASTGTETKVAAPFIAASSRKPDSPASIAAVSAAASAATYKPTRQPQQVTLKPSPATVEATASPDAVEVEPAPTPTLALSKQPVTPDADTPATVAEVATQQLGPQVQGSVQAEVSAQIATAMSGDSLRKAVEEVFQQSLPTITAQLTSTIEQTLRQDLAEKTAEVVKEVVRELAEQKVGELLSTTVPDIAEAQIKKEIERLTAAP